MQDYRVYIDESGDHTYRNLGDLSARYLGITGFVCGRSYYESSLAPALEQLKRDFFPYDLDMPPILMRRDLVKRRGLFPALLDAEVEKKWRRDLLRFLRSLDSRHCTIFFSGH